MLTLGNVAQASHGYIAQYAKITNVYIFNITHSLNMLSDHALSQQLTLSHYIPVCAQGHCVPGSGIPVQVSQN